jgi:predicted transcriptional regulator
VTQGVQSKYESLWCLSNPVALRWEILKKLVRLYKQTGNPVTAAEIQVTYRQADAARLDALVESGMAESVGSANLREYKPTEYGEMFIHQIEEMTDRWSSLHGKRNNPQSS